MTRVIAMTRWQQALLALTIVVLVLVLFGISQLVHAQLTPEEELGQQGLDFLNSLGAGWAVAAILMARQFAEIAAKLIPDSATGALGLLRKVLKILAAYIPTKK